MKPEEIWARAAVWAGHPLTDTQLDTLGRFKDWLLNEAVKAGGLGPHEVDRIDNRHLGDSLVFAAGFPTPPTEIVDVGSGVGLPGIPLAIMLPETEVILLDRSGRRVDLMKRALRVLGLSNARAVHADIEEWEHTVDGVVSRASLSPEQAVTSFKRLLKPAGRAVVGGSWASKPGVSGFEYLEVPATVLDQRVWLLIMPQQ